MTLTKEGKEWDSKRVFELIRIEEHLKKRLKECETNSNGISMKDDWVEYKFQIRLVPELQKILGKK